MPSLIRKAVAGAAVGGAALWGIGGIDDTTRDDQGQIVESGDLGVFVTQVGDCLNLVDPDSQLVTKTQGVPCSNPHHWQVVYKGAIDLEEFDQNEIDRQSEIICKYAIEEIVQRISYSKWEEFENAQTNYFSPTEESFSEGDRAVDCLVGSDIETYTSSLIE